jgi:uracil-DNA glycosylase
MFTSNRQTKSKDPYEFVLPEKNWLDIIGTEFDQPYMEQLKQFLKREEDDGRIIYPKRAEIFNALNLTAFENIKVVIIGQDPYHGAGQAHGLCFSTKGIDIPRSLSNIYKEIDDEYDPIKMPRHGNLTKWAAQGVLLVNARLTVQKDRAGSHQRKGWEKFTDAIIRAVNGKPEPVVFLLWGSSARKKGLRKKDGVELIDRKKHKVLEASHPSPLSARHSFFGCDHFKKANDYLIKHGLKPVEWQRI